LGIIRDSTVVVAFAEIGTAALTVG
jgi:hypothetical protein